MISKNYRAAMKAISINQAFAEIIISCEKIVENRDWDTDYRGQLAIHASYKSRYLDEQALSQYARGGVIGQVTFKACIHIDELKQLSESDSLVPETEYYADELLNHAHTKGPWCLVLSGPIRFDQILPCKGQLRLWDWEDEGKG
jgi:hypothetical protein